VAESNVSNLTPFRVCVALLTVWSALWCQFSPDPDDDASSSDENGRPGIAGISSDKRVTSTRPNSFGSGTPHSTTAGGSGNGINGMGGGGARGAGKSNNSNNNNNGGGGGGGGNFRPPSHDAGATAWMSFGNLYHHFRCVDCAVLASSANVSC
jgi:hypothetical protein